MPDFGLFGLPILAWALFSFQIGMIRAWRGRTIWRCIRRGGRGVIHQYSPTSISGASLTTAAAAAMLANTITKKAKAGAR